VSGYSEIRYQLDGKTGVAMLTLDRRDSRNALTFTTYAELEDAVRTTSARCLIITGVDPAFCSGDDVKRVMAAAGDRLTSDLQREPALTPAADALLHTDIPVIAAVNGAAVGWGMELALMADIRVASDRARFGELFVKRGLCCDAAGLGRLAQLIGRERAAELLFTGRVIDADEAAAIGLVSRVVPHGDLRATVTALAGEIAANPPLAVQRLKAGLRRALDPDWHDLGVWVSASLAELFASEDHKEGVAAFMEKRHARFQGR
jgi:enoyl-CoA hydratase